MNMKTFGTMNLVLGLGLMIAAGVAHATPEKWTGEGVLFGRDGAKVGTYHLDLTNTEISTDETRNDVTVTIGNGTILKLSQTTHKSGNSFSIVGDTGNGGGYCFGDGLCQIYVEQSNGTAYAITLIKDSEDQMRLMKTELKNGQATRFFREGLSRVR
jgi:hypothetical protein